MRKAFVPLAVAGLFCLLLAQVSATPITLTNTGTGALGSLETIYQLTKVPPGDTNTNLYVTSSPPLSWMANTATAKWISPQASYWKTTSGTDYSADYDPTGFYTFSLAFNLTGLDPATATISGSWAVDNRGKIYLNGTYTDNALTGDTSFGSVSSFVIKAGSGGFRPGLNTLDFVIENLASGAGMPRNPVGLFVDGLSGSAESGSIIESAPEPATITIFGLGLLALAVLHRRRRSS